MEGGGRVKEILKSQKSETVQLNEHLKSLKRFNIEVEEIHTGSERDRLIETPKADHIFDNARFESVENANKPSHPD
jgi:hypothetical protein